MGNVAITTSDPSSSFCFRSFPQDWAYLVGLLDGNFEGDEISFTNTTPVAEDRSKPWFRINADGTPDKIYSYSSGNWLALHPIPPGIIVMWDGAEASIPTLDGGEAATITATTGPIWVKVTALDARFPVGPGTFPISGTVVPVGGTGGLERVTLTTAEMPAHVHSIKIGGADATSGGSVIESAQNPDSPQGTKNTDSTGSGEPHNNIPPYYGIFFIKRTARLYYRI